MRISIVSGSGMKSTKDSVFKAKIKDVSGGEGGIRTREKQGLYAISSRARSSTPAPLQSKKQTGLGPDDSLALESGRIPAQNPV